MNTLMRRSLALTLVLAATAPQTTRAEDCALGKRYMTLAQDQMTKFATDDAQGYLQKSLEVCPTYDAYQQLGELAAQSDETDARKRAVDAFVAAHALAPSNEARARSLYHYAQLLDASGDPQNAYPLIKAAKSLDPDDEKILKLDASLEQQIRNPTADALRAGLKASLYKPLRLAPAVAAGTSAPAIAMAKVPAPAGGAVTIQINFVTGRTTVDDETRPNIMTLARILAEPELRNQKFVLIGHADARGDEAQNMALSWRRAEAIRDTLLIIEPSLTNRLEVDGKGESQLLEPGTDEKAHRANRRLQVLRKPGKD
jgi:outer membrane protein OmpA-like peptidoglycan-associated protein